MSRYIDAELAKAQFTGNFESSYGTPQIKAYIDEVPTADVMPRTKQAAIDYLEEIGWMKEHDREVTIAARNFVGFQYWDATKENKNANL